MIVIADTSPLNYLIRIGHIDILPELYHRVFVPTTVCAALASLQAPEAVRTSITTPPEGLEIRKTQQQPGADMVKARLDAGEQDAIPLALELGSQELIIDDFDGRREAQRRNLHFVGTLGVLRLGSTHRLARLAASHGEASTEELPCVANADRETSVRDLGWILLLT